MRPVEYVVVQRELDRPYEEDEVRAIAENTGCFDMYGVTLLRSYLSPDRTRMVCVFRAPDAEAVRTVNRVSSIPFTHVWTATLHTPP